MLRISFDKVIYPVNIDIYFWSEELEKYLFIIWFGIGCLSWLVGKLFQLKNEPNPKALELAINKYLIHTNKIPVFLRRLCAISKSKNIIDITSLHLQLSGLVGILYGSLSLFSFMPKNELFFLLGFALFYLIPSFFIRVLLKRA